MKSRLVIAVAALLFAFAACASKKEDTKKAEAPEKNVMAEPAMEQEMDSADEYGGVGSAMALEEGKMGKKDSSRGRGGGYAKKKPKASAPGSRPADDAPARGPGGGEQAPATRSWFPETFLFEPLVITDDQGAATVSVRVPDRLTTWRVLGLAHSRGGAQAGALTNFLGTLPTYIDPVVPPFLRAGDAVRIPIQLVNTTSKPVTTSMSVTVSNGALNGGSAKLTLPANGSVVRYATLRTKKPGVVRLLAKLGNADAIVREIEVLPTGRPVTQTSSGTLAAPRELTLVGVAQSDPTLGRARLTVFPGALALLRSELNASTGRGGIAEDAFALLLAGKAPELLRALGDEPDPEALRKMTLLISQRIVRHARVLDIDSASLLAEAALAHPDNPVLTRLGKRAVNTIESEQAPDGTCSGQTGWTLQRLLVATADCSRAAKISRFVPIRAAAAFARNAKDITDPYTAAAILATGAATGAFADQLRERVRGAIEKRKDGSQILKVPEGVVRGDGARPSTVEATALAVLALADDPKAPLADMGAAILASYSPRYGWGDGRTNLVCMQAVLQLFKDPIPDNVKIVLSMDGTAIAEGVLDRDRVREVLTLEAGSLDAAGSHQWSVSADPAVPGLGYSLELTSWAPWGPPPKDAGLELVIGSHEGAAVGKPVNLTVQATAPSGRSLVIEIALPSGTHPDGVSLDALVASGALSRYEKSDETLTLHVNPLAPAKIFSATLRVIPTLGGSLQSGAASIQLGRTKVHIPPTRWTIK